MAAALLADFPLRSYWSLPSGAPRFAPVSPTKVALLGYQWVRTSLQLAGCASTHAHLAQMCALLVFVAMSNQRAGLWGPSLEACSACNGTQLCISGVGGPHGLGCPYTAFGQFQCVRSGARGVPENRTSTWNLAYTSSHQVSLCGGCHVVDRYSHPAWAGLYGAQPAADDGS